MMQAQLHTVYLLQKSFFAKVGASKTQEAKEKMLWSAILGSKPLKGRADNLSAILQETVSLYKQAPAIAQASQQHHLPKLLNSSSPPSEAEKREVWKCRQGTVTGQPSIRMGRESKVENFDISLGLPLESPILPSVLERVGWRQRGSTRRRHQARGEPGQRRNQKPAGFAVGRSGMVPQGPLHLHHSALWSSSHRDPEPGCRWAPTSPTGTNPCCLHCIPAWSSPTHQNPEGDLRLATFARFELKLSLNRSNYTCMRCRIIFAAFGKSWYASLCFSHFTCKRKNNIIFVKHHTPYR